MKITKTIMLLTLAAILMSVSTAAEDLAKKAKKQDVVGVDSKNKEMIEAQKKAKQTLITFYKAIQNPDKDKRYLLKVKLTEGDVVEHVWLEPVKFVDPGLKGILAVDPIGLKKHKKGDLIEPLPSQISDWVILSPDGTQQGGFTMKVVEKQKRKNKKSKKEETKE